MLPADDLSRNLAVARSAAHDGTLPHVAVAGGVYTVLVSGGQTNGRYALIDMHVPPGAGPPPHRHDFEEMFHVLEGTVEVTFRGVTSTAAAGDTVSIPANAPHAFKNVSSRPARLLCTGVAGRRRGVLPRDRRPRADPHRPPPDAERGRSEGARREGQGAVREIHERDSLELIYGRHLYRLPSSTFTVPLTVPLQTPILSTRIRGLNRFAIQGRGDAIIVAVEMPYMEFAGTLFRSNRQLVLRSGEDVLRVERFEHVHVDNPSEAFGAFGMMAKDAPDWLSVGVEVQVFDGGTGQRHR